MALASVSVGEVAREVGVTPTTIRNWIEKGYIRAFRMPSGVRRIPVSEFQRLVSEYFALAPAQPAAEGDTLSMADASDDGVWAPAFVDEGVTVGSSDRPSRD